MASRLDYVVVSPSLLENLTIRPVPPRFNLGMEEWADACLESLEQSLSASLTGEDDCFGDYDDTMLSCPSYYPKSHPPTSALAVALPLQPHPQLSQRSQPSPKNHPLRSLVSPLSATKS